MTNSAELDGVVLNREAHFFPWNFNLVESRIVHIVHGATPGTQKMVVPICAVLIARNRAGMTNLTNHAKRGKMLQDSIHSGSRNFWQNFTHLTPNIIDGRVV